MAPSDAALAATLNGNFRDSLTNMKQSAWRSPRRGRRCLGRRGRRASERPSGPGHGAVRAPEDGRRIAAQAGRRLVGRRVGTYSSCAREHLALVTGTANHRVGMIARTHVATCRDLGHSVCSWNGRTRERTATTKDEEKKNSRPAGAQPQGGPEGRGSGRATGPRPPETPLRALVGE
eukprot:753961-Prymnesium_polylepis.1